MLALLSQLNLGFALPGSSQDVMRPGMTALAPRTRVAMETATSEKQCAMISLSAEDPLRLAQVLKKAWMEGGVKRGLVGTVFVLDEEQRVLNRQLYAKVLRFVCFRILHVYMF